MRRFSRLLFLLSLLALTVGAAAPGGFTQTDPAAPPAAAQPADPMTSGPPARDKPSVPGWGFWPAYPASWMGVHRGFLKRTEQGREKQDISVVFLGDSITQGWGKDGKTGWETRYAPRGAVNYGIGGDTTRQVLWRIQNGEIDGIRPKAVVLMIGTNNLYNDHNAGTDEEIAAGIEAVVKQVREKLPETKILLLGILPRQNEYFSGRARSINALLRKLEDGRAVRFLDMSEKFQSDPGKVNPDLYSADKLHLAQKGYEIWADAMTPLFEEMMK